LVFLVAVLLLGLLLAFLFGVVLAFLRPSLLLRLIFLVVLELARVFFFPHVHLVLLAVVVVLGLFRPCMA
jgi:hypothetical protein